MLPIKIRKVSTFPTVKTKQNNQLMRQTKHKSLFIRAQGHISLLRNHVATLSSLRGYFNSGFVCYFLQGSEVFRLLLVFKLFLNCLVLIISRNFVSVLVLCILLISLL